MTFDTWRQARDYAQDQADATGYDYGVRKPTRFDPVWLVRLLPSAQNRFGHELTSYEVVRPVR